MTVVGERVSVSEREAARMRDAMTHRGPDDAGLETLGNVVLGHRRLSIIDPGPAGHQPMATPDRRWWIVYNGELYNDAALRRELERAGVVFRTRCDTETLLAACATWGVEEAVSRARGMYAFGAYDSQNGRAWLARDPLGIKPLYYAQVGGEVVFASEIGAILAHPRVSARPDMAAVSAYLTTIRTTMGERTLYEGVRAALQGEVIEVDLTGRGAVTLAKKRVRPRGTGDAWDIRRTVTESVEIHLRSDVPMCALLSGGLDSSIACAVARRRMEALHTYCSGGRAEEGAVGSSDFEHARLVAGHLGTTHTEAPVTRGLFTERWAEMVRRMRVPLSTPNEVAINEVARTLRRAGHAVTLSGEGADELFGGYDGPLSMALHHVERGNHDPGLFQLTSAAWIAPNLKPSVFTEHAWREAGEDAGLAALYRRTFAELEEESEGTEPLEVHLRFQRRVNLVGLLQRLDTSTMLESVEGRTPFADVVVAAAADALPMSRKYREVRGEDGNVRSETKIALREAFAGDLPRAVVERPKASFPLPFQGWLEDQRETIRRSAFAREVFSEAAISAVIEKPREMWSLAWPMANLALWGG